MLFNPEVDTQLDHKASVEGLLQFMGMKMFEELQHPSKAIVKAVLALCPASLELSTKYLVAVNSAGRGDIYKAWGVDGIRGRILGGGRCDGRSQSHICY